MNCVYRASSVEQADIVVAWLEEQGVAAFVKDRHMAAGYAPFAIAPRGIEVCVVDSQNTQKAEGLLTDHFAELKERPRPSPADKFIRARCEECGRTVDFPSELFGTVQSCPGCRANMDVGEQPHFC